MSSKDIHQDRILIIDFGGQTTIILSGGPESTIEKNSPQIAAEILKLDVPMLGICYGMQAMVHQLGGVVEAHRGESEFGYASMKVSGSCGKATQ